MTALPAVAPVEVDPTDVAHLDFEVSCGFDECERVADWWLVCLACGAHAPICEPHRRREVILIEGTLGLRAICHECNAGTPGRLWRSLFAFVPIGRG